MRQHILSWLTKLTTSKEDIRFEYEVEYGPYLRQNPVATSDSFYTFIGEKAKRYITKHTTVLDVGCGLGRLVIDLANSGAKESLGIDINDYFIYEAKAIAGNHRNNILQYTCHGNYTFLTGNIQKLPFANNTFSLALCINVIDRITNPAAGVAELYRILQPEGVLLLCTPYDWMDHLTPKRNQVSDLSQLIDPKRWKLLEEHDNIPYNLKINNRRVTQYKNHLVILKKK